MKKTIWALLHFQLLCLPCILACTMITRTDFKYPDSERPYKINPGDSFDECPALCNNEEECVATQFLQACMLFNTEVEPVESSGRQVAIKDCSPAAPAATLTTTAASTTTTAAAASSTRIMNPGSDSPNRSDARSTLKREGVMPWPVSDSTPSSWVNTTLLTNDTLCSMEVSQGHVDDGSSQILVTLTISVDSCTTLCWNMPECMGIEMLVPNRCTLYGEVPTTVYHPDKTFYQKIECETELQCCFRHEDAQMVTGSDPILELVNDEETCVALCQLVEECQAVTYNSRNGECTILTERPNGTMQSPGFTVALKNCSGSNSSSNGAISVTQICSTGRLLTEVNRPGPSENKPQTPSLSDTTERPKTPQLGHAHSTAAVLEISTVLSTLPAWLGIISAIIMEFFPLTWTPIGG